MLGLMGQLQAPNRLEIISYQIKSNHAESDHQADFVHGHLLSDLL